MSSLKLRKIAKIVKEINIDPSQTRYDIAGLTLGLCKFFYRTPQNLFQDLNIGDYTIDTSNNSQVLVIQNNELLRIMEAVQVCYILDITSSKYETDFNVDINQLKDEYNNLVDDVHALWDYIKKVGIVTDDTSMPLILPQLNTDEVWVKTEDGYKGISLTDAEGIIKGVIEEYTSLMEKRLDAYVEDPLKPRLNEHVETVNKPELDRYVEETNKPALDDYTTQLEERLQTMIDQAVADKGLMPEGSDWFEIALGNWLVTDLFNKNYTNYPPQLNSSDNAGVVKKDITDGGNSQIIRYYTTTGKMLFIVRVNKVWSEWQELGEQTDTMQFTQANHGFVFTAVTLDGATRKWVKANKYTSADRIAIKIDNDRFDVVTRGVVNIPTSARDDKGAPFVYDEYYFLSQEVDGGLSRTKNEIGTFQYLVHISEIDGKQVAYIDIGDSYDLDYEVVDTETADRVGIGTYKTTLRTADTIEDLKRLNLKEGDVVEVLGYYAKGDGSDHKRKIESKDDGSGVLLNNRLYANIIHNGEVNVSWFGIKYNVEQDSIDDNLILFNYYILDKFSKYKYATTYVVGVNGKTISTLGSCQFIKENIEIKINSDIKTTYGYQEHFDKDPNIQSRGHWLAVFGGWIDEPNFVMKPANMIRIGGVGSIESVYSDKNIRLHNHNCIGFCRANNCLIEDIRILGSDHNGIVLDSDTFFLKIQNVQIKNCYDIPMNLKNTKHWKPEPDGISQDKIGGMIVDNCEITPMEDRVGNPLIRVEGDNIIVKNCYFDCRLHKENKQRNTIWLKCKNTTITNCIFNNTFHIVRPYDSNICSNISVENCNIKDCDYIALLEFNYALKNLIIKNNIISGYMYSPVGIPSKAQEQELNIEVMLNDCSGLTSAFDFNGSHFYSFNKGKSIFKYNHYKFTPQEFVCDSETFPIIPTVQNKEIEIDVLRKYRYIVLYFAKTPDNTVSFLNIPILFFFNSSMPLNLHLNEECDISITEIEENKKISISTSSSKYKLSMITYM